mmetsp:Transcript_127953/g.368649  ORF Transcript_127953/g.368649 Transcript_127953/m.368649 type:complete len:211 (-) Transcript_127953:201-833(-)
MLGVLCSALHEPTSPSICAVSNDNTPAQLSDDVQTRQHPNASPWQSIRAKERQHAATKGEAQRAQPPRRRVWPTRHVALRPSPGVATPLAGKETVEAMRLRGGRASSGRALQHVLRWQHRRRLEAELGDTAAHREPHFAQPATHIADRDGPRVAASLAREFLVEAPGLCDAGARLRHNLHHRSCGCEPPDRPCGNHSLATASKAPSCCCD